MRTPACTRLRNIRYYHRHTLSVDLVNEITQIIDDALWVVC